MDIEKIEAKLNYYAQKIIVSGSKIDEHALGELNFYMALRRIYERRSTIQDLGMMDAINDTLQEAEIISPRDTFYSIKPPKKAAAPKAKAKPVKPKAKPAKAKTKPKKYRITTKKVAKGIEKLINLAKAKSKSVTTTKKRSTTTKKASKKS